MKKSEKIVLTVASALGISTLGTLKYFGGITNNTFDLGYPNQVASCVERSIPNIEGSNNPTGKRFVNTVCADLIKLFRNAKFEGRISQGVIVPASEAEILEAEINGIEEAESKFELPFNLDITATRSRFDNIIAPYNISGTTTILQSRTPESGEIPYDSLYQNSFTAQYTGKDLDNFNLQSTEYAEFGVISKPLGVRYSNVDLSKDVSGGYSAKFITKSKL